MVMTTNLPYPRTIRRFAAISAVGLFTALGIGAAATQNAGASVASPSPTSGTGRTIVVDGTGRVSETPDQMILNLGVETRALRVSEALKANNDSAATINKLLKARGIEARDIQTSGLSIYPQFDNTGRKITAYQVNNSITVKIRNLATSGELIDAVATAAGDAIRINGLSFAVADTAKSQARARELAVGDARTQAEQLAKAAGVRLGALRTIRTSVDNSVPVQGQFSQASVAKAADTPIEAGSFEVSASVQLVYDIS